MAKLTLTLKQNAIFQAIGAAAYVRARTVAERGAVAQVAWDERERRASATVLGDPRIGQGRLATGDRSDRRCVHLSAF